MTSLGNTDSSLMNDEAMLNILMYLDKYIDIDKFKGKSIKEILEEINSNMGFPECDGIDDNDKRYIHLLNHYAESGQHDSFCELKLFERNSDAGALACCFVSPEEYKSHPKKAYFVYKGTNGNEWMDNAHGLSGEVNVTQQQFAAKNFFDDVINKNHWNDDVFPPDIYVTGHSKGGNKTQFVTMMADNADLIKKSYSFDGQGFSPEAIEYIKDTCGEDVYNSRLEKLYSISNSDDPINVLGDRLVREDHVVYLKTSSDRPILDYVKPPVMNHHFPDCYVNEDGSLTGFTTQGSLSKYFENGCADAMKIPVPLRGIVMRGIMGICENTIGGGADPISGEEINWFEEFIGGVAGLALITGELRWETSELGILEKIFELIVSLFEGPTTIDEYEEIEEKYSITCSKIEKLDEKKINSIQPLLDFTASSVAVASEYINNIGYNSQDISFNNTHIKINTDSLRDYSVTLRNINKRVDDIDLQLQNLYQKVGLVDLAAMLDRDMLAEHSGKLNNYSDFLEATAFEFDQVEQRVQNYV